MLLLLSAAVEMFVMWLGYCSPIPITDSAYTAAKFVLSKAQLLKYAYSLALWVDKIFGDAENLGSLILPEK